MPVKPLAADKPKIVFHVAMMAIQNFGFFIMYFTLWLNTPALETCDETRFAEGLMALTCFLVSWLCIGMGFGGYTEDPFLFLFYWVAHAWPAVFGYCTCTFLIPIARFSETGKACAALAPVIGSAVQIVYIIHAGLFFHYVGNMLSVTYPESTTFEELSFGDAIHHQVSPQIIDQIIDHADRLGSGARQPDVS
eukprot:gene1042-biopygen5772